MCFYAGLEVRLPTEETKYFDFAWPTFCYGVRSLDWMGLAQHQVMYTHMQMYELQHGKSLSFFIATLGSMTSARALLLINVYDGFKLDAKFHPESEGPCIPTMVVPHKTGQELMEISKMYGRDVQVRIQHGGGEAGGEGEGEGEGEVAGDPDEWDVIPSPQPQGTSYSTYSMHSVLAACCAFPNLMLPLSTAEEVPCFSSPVQSVSTYTAIKDGKPL